MNSLKQLAGMVHEVIDEDINSIYDSLLLISTQLPMINIFSYDYKTVAYHLQEWIGIANYVADKTSFTQWLAGYIDAKGVISCTYAAKVQTMRVELEINHSDKEFLEHLQVMIGGYGNITVKERKSSNFTYYSYAIGSRVELLPILSAVVSATIYKTDIIQAAIDLLNIFNTHGGTLTKGSYTPPIKNRVWTLYDRIKVINKGGNNENPSN